MPTVQQIQQQSKVKIDKLRSKLKRNLIHPQGGSHTSVQSSSHDSSSVSLESSEQIGFTSLQSTLSQIRERFKLKASAARKKRRPSIDSADALQIDDDWGNIGTSSINSVDTSEGASQDDDNAESAIASLDPLQFESDAFDAVQRDFIHWTQQPGLLIPACEALSNKCRQWIERSLRGSHHSVISLAWQLMRRQCVANDRGRLFNELFEPFALYCFAKQPTMLKRLQSDQILPIHEQESAASGFTAAESAEFYATGISQPKITQLAPVFPVNNIQEVTEEDDIEF